MKRVPWRAIAVLALGEWSYAKIEQALGDNAPPSCRNSFVRRSYTSGSRRIRSPRSRQQLSGRGTASTSFFHATSSSLPAAKRRHSRSVCPASGKHFTGRSFLS